MLKFLLVGLGFVLFSVVGASYALSTAPILLDRPIGEFRLSVTESARETFVASVEVFSKSHEFSYENRPLRPDGKHFDISLRSRDINIKIVNPFDPPEDFIVDFYDGVSSPPTSDTLNRVIAEMKEHFGKINGVSIHETK
jgi:hypothetical protein